MLKNEGWIQLWYIIRTFINVAMYSQYNSNKRKEKRKRKPIKMSKFVQIVYLIRDLFLRYTSNSNLIIKRWINRWCTPTIPALKRQRNHEFEASLEYTVRLSQKQSTKHKQIIFKWKEDLNRNFSKNIQIGAWKVAQHS
jgi:hypothetical protein